MKAEKYIVKYGNGDFYRGWKTPAKNLEKATKFKNKKNAEKVAKLFEGATIIPVMVNCTKEKHERTNTD